MEGVYLLLTPAELRAWQFEEGDETLLGRPNIEVPNMETLEHATENIAHQLASLANAKGMTTAFIVEMVTVGHDFGTPALAGRLYKGYAPNRGYTVLWRMFKARETLEAIDVPEELLTTCFNQDAVFDMFEFLRGAREGLNMNKALFEWVKGGFSEYYSAQELGRIMMVRGLTAMRDDLEIIDDTSYDGPRAEGLRWIRTSRSSWSSSRAPGASGRRSRRRDGMSCPWTWTRPWRTSWSRMRTNT